MFSIPTTGAGQIFNLPRTDDFSRRGKRSHLTAKVVSTVAFQNKIKNLSCTPYNLLLNTFLSSKAISFILSRSDWMKFLLLSYLNPKPSPLNLGIT